MAYLACSVSQPHTKCIECGEESGRKQCGCGNGVHYCSEECQAKGYDAHRPHCYADVMKNLPTNPTKAAAALGDAADFADECLSDIVSHMARFKQTAIMFSLMREGKAKTKKLMLLLRNPEDGGRVAVRYVEQSMYTFVQHIRDINADDFFTLCAVSTIFAKMSSFQNMESYSFKLHMHIHTQILAMQSFFENDNRWGKYIYNIKPYQITSAIHMGMFTKGLSEASDTVWAGVKGKCLRLGWRITSLFHQRSAESKEEINDLCIEYKNICVESKLGKGSREYGFLIWHYYRWRSNLCFDLQEYSDDHKSLQNARCACLKALKNARMIGVETSEVILNLRIFELCLLTRTVALKIPDDMNGGELLYIEKERAKLVTKITKITARKVEHLNSEMCIEINERVANMMNTLVRFVEIKLLELNGHHDKVCGRYMLLLKEMKEFESTPGFETRKPRISFHRMNIADVCREAAVFHIKMGECPETIKTLRQSTAGVMQETREKYGFPCASVVAGAWRELEACQ
jgi:hypothetical protein